MKQDTRTKVIFALVRKNGQTFTELLESADTNRDSLSKILKVLDREKIIKKDDVLYYFSTDIKNRVLLDMKGAYHIATQMDGFLDRLEKSNNSVNEGAAMLQRTVAIRNTLQIEHYTSLKLTKREKLEFELFDDIFEAVIESIFEIIKKQSPQKLKRLKQLLTINIPKELVN